MFLTDPIVFPHLGITLDPAPAAFSIGGKAIYWYGIIIAVGFLAAYAYMSRRAPLYGCTSDDALDAVLWAVPIGVICARLYYCIFYWELYADDPIKILYIWEGGLAIYGSVIGGIVALLFVARHKKMPPLTLMDLAAPAVMIGQIFGRWGNFFNREAFGGYTDNFLAMRLLESHLPAQTRATEAGQKLLEMAKAGGYEGYIQVHPTFLYESVWNLAGFIALHFYAKKRKFDGEIFLLYLAWYGLGRVWIEGLRTDSLYLFSTGIRVSQLLAGVMFLVGGGIIAYVRLRKKPDGSALYVNRKAAAEAAEAKAEDI